MKRKKIIEELQERLTHCESAIDENSRDDAGDIQLALKQGIRKGRAGTLILCLNMLKEAK